MATKTIERPTTRATVRYIGRSAYKVRHVIDLIRGKDAEEAQNILLLCERGAKEEVGKLLNSAIANAEHNNQIPVEELRVVEAFVDEGPTAKRFRPRARGRGNRILKRSCHITIVLERMEQDEIETKSAKDSSSGAANAREQRRRRTEASKAAAKAKQEALDAENEDGLLEDEEVVSDKPKQKSPVSRESSSSEAVSRPSGQDEPKVSSLAANASSDDDSRKTKSTSTKKPAAKKAASEAEPKKKTKKVKAESQGAKDEQPRESSGTASDSTTNTEEGDA